MHACTYGRTNVQCLHTGQQVLERPTQCRATQATKVKAGSLGNCPLLSPSFQPLLGPAHSSPSFPYQIRAPMSSFLHTTLIAHQSAGV